MAAPARSRRSVLQTLGWAVAGAAGLWRFLTPRRSEGDGGSVRAVVPRSSLPAGGALVLPLERVAIVKEEANLLALDLACTHLGCTVSANASGFACPCHGSRFACGGQRLAGPAKDGLRRLQVEQTDGEVRVTDSFSFDERVG